MIKKCKDCGKIGKELTNDICAECFWKSQSPKLPSPKNSGIWRKY